MAIVVKQYTFSAGAVIVASEHNANADTLFNDYNGNITNANISASAGIVDTKLAGITTAGKVSGAALTLLPNIPAAAGVIPAANLTGTWTDYSATSTISNWSSYTNKNLYYKKIGKSVFVSFYIAGVSNGTSASFTLPYVSAILDIVVPIATVNNGAEEYTGIMQLTTTSSTAICYRDLTGTLWTDSGNKTIAGQFFYDTTT